MSTPLKYKEKKDVRKTVLPHTGTADPEDA